MTTNLIERNDILKYLLKNKLFFISIYILRMFGEPISNAQTMQHIFNVKAITKKVPNKPKIGNIYWKTNQTFITGIDLIHSPELIQEIADVIKKDTSNTLKKLRALKYKAQLVKDEEDRIARAIAKAQAKANKK